MKVDLENIFEVANFLEDSTISEKPSKNNSVFSSFLNLKPELEIDFEQNQTFFKLYSNFERPTIRIIVEKDFEKFWVHLDNLLSQYIKTNLQKIEYSPLLKNYQEGYFLNLKLLQTKTDSYSLKINFLNNKRHNLKQIIPINKRNCFSNYNLLEIEQIFTSRTFNNCKLKLQLSNGYQLQSSGKIGFTLILKEITIS